MKCHNSDAYPSLILYPLNSYVPTDYPTDAEWSARLLVERSTAIKVRDGHCMSEEVSCPNS